MAREESQREDLMREATALVERVEVSIAETATGASPIVAGFRTDGEFSLFCGEDPAYHFNAAGQLRRAYDGGLLFKATGGRLVSLRRERTAEETQLVRHELTPDEQREFMSSMMERLRAMAALLASGDFEVTKEIPASGDVVDRVRQWLAAHQEPGIALRPNVAGHSRPG